MLSVSAGAGIQLCMMTFVSLVFACLGFLSPNCKVLLTTLLVLNVFLGIMARYVAARFYKRTEVLQWKNNVLIIAFLYPGIVYGIFFDFKLVLWSYHSAAAILFATLLALLLSLQYFDIYLDSTIVPVRIFRDHIPLGFIN